MATRLSIARTDIFKALDALPSRVLRQGDIGALLEREREFWRLTKSTTVRGFTAYLLETGKLHRVHLSLPHRAETLFVWREASPLAIACAAKRGAYLCHYSAMRHHELTLQVPEVYYANHEQRPVPPPTGGLTQRAIDNAFRGQQRQSANQCDFLGKRLCLVNGKHTGRLGVVEAADEFGQTYSVTGLERTLIDITVRPYYAGGVAEVLQAFRSAADRVSLNRLSALLERLDFVYPYRQAIGWYLDRSGAYRPAQMDLFRQSPFEFDFYLTYGMTDREYSADWRVHFPAGL
jgi:predicted transcriptional regulator of viral defense system